MKSQIEEHYNYICNSFPSTNIECYKLKKFDKNHIFFEILNFLSKEISLDEKMAMFFSFNNFQRSLDEARDGNNRFSSYWIKYTNNYNFEFSPSVKKGIDSLYYPMLAYNEYTNMMYDKAIFYLNLSIQLQTELEAEGFEDILSAKIEQILNIGRTLYSMGDLEKMNDIISDLIVFLAYSKTCENLSELSKRIINKESHIERLSTIDYIIDSILGKIIFSKEKSVQEKDESIYNLINSIYDKNKNLNDISAKGFDKIIQLIMYLKNDKFDDFLQNFDLFLINISYTPKMLQFIILEKFKKLSFQFLEFDKQKKLQLVLSDYYKRGLNINVNDYSSSNSYYLTTVKSVIK